MKSGKPSAGLIWILLLAVLWLFYNATVNRHVHILSDGYVISHAHPFAENTSDSGQNGGADHRHSEKELMLLSLFASLVFTFLILLIMRPFLYAAAGLLRDGSEHQSDIRDHYQVFHYHAPPGTV
jgi:hypothetical protein